MSAARPVSRSVALPVGRTLAWALFAVWAIGQIWRDRTLVTAWAFYLPSALVAGVLLLLAVGEAFLRRFRRAGLLCVLALAPAVTVLALENRWLAPVAPPAGGADLRVVAWNVADFPRGVERAAALLRPLDADLVLLSEAPGKPPQELEHQLGGGLRLTPLGAMAVFTREAPLEVEWLAREGELQVALVRWAVAGRTLGVLAVNVISSPRVPRDPLLERIVAMIEQRAPDLVLGDFNAPRRSRALARLPTGFRHAYDSAGSGWSSTWPAALPLLAIDQTIVGPRLAVRGYSLRTTRISDHRLQLTELDFAVPASGGSG
jgi:endonuclease/exonuclease/phosphatase (EEP) superfamily protein YafD